MELGVSTWKLLRQKQTRLWVSQILLLQFIYYLGIKTLAFLAPSSVFMLSRTKAKNHCQRYRMILLHRSQSWNLREWPSLLLCFIQSLTVKRCNLGFLMLSLYQDYSQSNITSTHYHHFLSSHLKNQMVGDKEIESLGFQNQFVVPVYNSCYI